MEPERVYPLAPSVPSEHPWKRGWQALVHERRLPTRLVVGWDRFLISIGWRRKTIRVDGLEFVVRRLAADEHFVRDIVNAREYTPAGYEIGETDIVVDIGGHIGVFAVFAARCALRGRVVTVEPVSNNFQLLQRNLARNGCCQVTAVRAALSVAAEPVVVFVHPQATGGHSVIAELAGHSSRHEKVEGVTLAELLRRFALPRCNFLKLDCEGAEFEALAGLPADLAERIDKIVMEYHTRSAEPKQIQAQRLIDRLQQLGFQVDRYTDVMGTYWGMIYARRRSAADCPAQHRQPE